MPSFLDIPQALCHSCGTCIAACPHRALGYIEGHVKLVEECDHCGACYLACPGIAVDFKEMNHRLFPDHVPDPYFGCFRAMYIGRSDSRALTGAFSSGGAVTEILCSALGSNLIQGAIVCAMSEARPFQPEIRIARTVGEISGAAGSKYTLLPINSALAETGNLRGPLALVGLPCHIHGIRKLQQSGAMTASPITHTIGLFCGFNLTPEATPFLLKKLGIDPHKVSSLSYRGGEWPGSFTVSTRDGKILSIPKQSYNFLHLTHLPPRCAVCPDLFAELADISIGDYWPDNDAERGYSSIIVRTEKGKELLQAAGSSLQIKDLTSAQLYRSHAHLIQYKKRAISVRLSLSPTTPAFNLPHLPLSMPEKISAALFFVTLHIGRSRPARIMLGLLPLTALGWLARGFRGRSKKRLGGKGNRYWSLDDVGRHWDATEDYDEINVKTYSYGRRFSDGYRVCAGEIREGDRILDIACRTGNGTLYFGKRKRIRMTGLDPSASMVSICRDRLSREGMTYQVLLWRDMRLPFDDALFDHIVSFETIEHIFAYHEFLSELSRVLKPGGGLLLTTPNVLWDPLHTFAAATGLHHGEGPHRFIPRKELMSSLAESGFKIDREESTVLIPYGPRWITRTGEWIENLLPEIIRRWICLRRILWCRKITADEETHNAQ
ncbi:MAG: Coenzyme F420 hydrogenase/dehydrogenase, beta subunit C-terminal domain [Candidatus Aureabacteria bacterium]|nr:Coenzyme F420 hydrogenase/dehydrogenase, beta subunit C-terminal domain [Candidatus Auribacterota bacterium]